VVVGDEGPETQFAWLGEDRIAYQVFGEGDIDLLFASTAGDAMDLRWYWPPYADFLRWLGTQARVIMFDRRGMGSSDSPSGEPLPSWEQWADDARAVLDAAGSERAVLCGLGDGGPIAVLFAASQPHRTRGLEAAGADDDGVGSRVQDGHGLLDGVVSRRTSLVISRARRPGMYAW
jgi:pimeloyl-ACP methyl ester carboxylesterase